MTEWETAIDSGEFYFTVNSDRKHQIFKMERKPNGLYWCCPLKETSHCYTWDVRKIRRACKNWTLVYKQEKVMGCSQLHKDPWKAAIAGDEFYFKSNYGSSLYKMKRRSDTTFICKATRPPLCRRLWSVREIKEVCKHWTLVENPNTQEQINVNNLFNVDNLYQKINAKQKLLGGLNKRSRDLAAQESETYALIVKEERQLGELKRELLSALKKELGS